MQKATQERIASIVYAFAEMALSGSEFGLAHVKTVGKVRLVIDRKRGVVNVYDADHPERLLTYASINTPNWTAESIVRGLMQQHKENMKPNTL